MKYHIGQVKKELGLSQKDLAEFFGMSYNSYANSSAKNRYEIALCRFFECVLLGGKKNETKNLTDTDHRINDESQPLILYGVSKSLNADELINSLGTPDVDNEYIIKPDKHGKWQIEHKHVGSGEPLKQWLTGKP